MVPVYDHLGLLLWAQGQTKHHGEEQVVERKALVSWYPRGKGDTKGKEQCPNLFLPEPAIPLVVNDPFHSGHLRPS